NSYKKETPENHFRGFQYNNLKVLSKQSLNFVGSFLEFCSTVEIKSAVINNFFSNISIGSLKSYDNWHSYGISHVPACINNSLRNTITSYDTTKNIYKNSFYFIIFQDKSQSFFYPFSICSSTNIKKVSRFSTRLLDKIHSRHCKSGTINHTSYVSVKIYIVKANFSRFYFNRAFFPYIA